MNHRSVPAATRFACLLALALLVPAGVASAAGYPGYPVYPGYPYPPDCTQYPDYPGCPPPGGGGGGGDQGGGGTDTGGQGDTGTPPAGDAGQVTPPPAGNPPGGTTLPPAPPRVSGPSSLGTLTPKADGTFGLPGVTTVCPVTAGGSCTVDAAATASGASASAVRKIVVARAHFKLRPGKSSAIRLKLTKAGKKLLARKRRLKLITKIVMTTPRGKKVAKTVRLKLQQRRHR